MLCQITLSRFLPFVCPCFFTTLLGIDYIYIYQCRHLYATWTLSFLFSSSIFSPSIFSSSIFSSYQTDFIRLCTRSMFVFGGWGPSTQRAHIDAGAYDSSEDQAEGWNNDGVVLECKDLESRGEARWSWPKMKVKSTEFEDSIYIEMRAFYCEEDVAIYKVNACEEYYADSIRRAHAQIRIFFSCYYYTLTHTLSLSFSFSLSLSISLTLTLS